MTECHFGWNCNRVDCWFVHPAGRAIDQQQSFVGFQYGTPGYAPPYMPASYVGMTQTYETSGMQNSRREKMPLPETGQPCRYGRNCQLPNCVYQHPDNNSNLNAGQSFADEDAVSDPELEEVLQEINNDSMQKYMASMTVSGDKDAEDALTGPDSAANIGDFDCPCCNGRPFQCETPACVVRGKCACQVTIDDEYERAIEIKPDSGIQEDLWIPSSCKCTCCAGYIYRCQHKPVCVCANTVSA